ncbi:hypothetical protein LINPERPRIM_LOCUS14229 [Linum perenne]
MAADCRDRRKHAASPFIKLVHPKGVVEMLTRPTRASDIMKKYPRHCVTRPDFFKYPWIVVHPDSVLKLGCVFYVVPFHTMDRLLKQNRQLVPSTPQRRGSKAAGVDCSLEMIGFDQLLLEHRSAPPPPPAAAEAAVEIRSKVDCRYGEIRSNNDVAIFPDCLTSRRRHKQETEIPTRSYDSPRTALSYYKKHRKEEEEQFEDCRDSFSLYDRGEGDCLSRLKTTATTLKPCLRKSSCGGGGGGGGSRGPDIRVKFTLPGEDDAKLRVEIFEFQRAD